MIAGVLVLTTLLTLIGRAEAAGFLLQLQDAQSVAVGPMTVHLRGSDGTERHLEAADDGQMPDLSAGDHTYSVPIPSFTDTAVEVTVENGSRSWTFSATVPLDDEKPLVRVVLGADGSARLAKAPSAPPAGMGMNGMGNGGMSPAMNGGPRTTAPGTPMPGGSVATTPGLSQVAAPARAAIFINSALLGGVGVGLGAGIVWLRRGRARVPRLSTPASAAAAVVRLGAESLADVVDGPLRQYRVVLLDAPDAPGPSRPHVFRCEEAGVTPRELVLAVEALAATAGPPVALLVTDLSALDRPGPSGAAAALVDAVAGRFPLYVVDGPDEWAAWTVAA